MAVDVSFIKHVALVQPGYYQNDRCVYSSDSQPGATWPPRGEFTSLGGGGGNTEHLGNWGGMDPFGGNQQIAINRPGCSSGWRIVAASPVIFDVTL